MFFFWYKREFREKIIATLKRIKRPDLIKKYITDNKNQYKTLIFRYE